MTLSYANTVATAELAFYTVAGCIAVALTVRHGWRKQLCWPVLSAFALARVLGAAMQLGTITAPLNLHLYRGSATLAHIGLSLLLFTTLGLITLVQNGVHRTRQTIVCSFVIHFQSLLLVVACILGIVGATSVPDSDFAGFTTTKVPSTLVASTVLYIIAFFMIGICTVSLCFHAKCVLAMEKRFLIATTASLPFLLVRIVYAALCIFLDNMEFHWFKGCLLMFIVLALIMEILVVTIYESAGLITAYRVPSTTHNASASGARHLDKSNDHGSSCSSNISARVGLLDVK